MPKRFLRLYSPQLSSPQPALLGRGVQLVLWNGTTLMGTLIGWTATQISLQGKATFWYNRRKHTHHISLADIQEMSVG